MNQIDVSIFNKQTPINPTQCNIINNNSIDKISDLCLPLQRVVIGLKYYSLFSVKVKNDAKIIEFFVNDVYPNPMMLNDFIHLIRVHKNDLFNINQLLTKSKLFEACDVSKCQHTIRHQTRNDPQPKQRLTKLDEATLFYCRKMDSIHFYLFHLYETGLRININEIEENADSHDENCSHFDYAFSRLNTIINERRKHTENFNRFQSTNNKFSLTINKNKNNTHKNQNNNYSSIMEEMFKHLLSECISVRKTITKLQQFCFFEEYDTDCIKYDISNGLFNGNINENKYDKIILHEIMEFMKKQEAQSSWFNIGYTFYYWVHYAEMEQFDCSTFMNQNDHFGYQIKELYVTMKYANFKEEMLNYIHMENPMINFTDVIEPKVNYYLQTNSVKEMRAFISNNAEGGAVKLVYDIKTGDEDDPQSGDQITFDHLLSVVLYTDFSALCTNFSASFRAVQIFERLQSIKARNRNYYWMSRRLRECVQLYGSGGRGWETGNNRVDDAIYEKKKGMLNGVYFSGLSFEAVFTSFEIRLCSPTSTTDAIVVAARFAGKKGIIVQLRNNIRFQRWYLRGFDCSYVSAYTEESETLFIGGHYWMAIDSIRTVANNNNYRELSTALSKLSKMINGDCIVRWDDKKYDNNVTKKEKKLLMRLLSEKLNKNKKTINDPYIKKTFESFTNNQKYILLNFACLEDNDYDLLNFIMNHIECNRDYEEYTDVNKETYNLFKPDLFTIFTNIEQITIRTTRKNGTHPSYLSFKSLLNIIESQSKLRRIIIIAVRKGSKKDNVNAGASWLSKHLGQEIIEKYKEKGFKIGLQKPRINPRLYVEDLVQIERYHS